MRHPCRCWFPRLLELTDREQPQVAPPSKGGPMAVRNNSIASGRSDAERAPLIEQLGRAFDAVAGLISNIRADQWSAPTPCTDWTVRQVVNHLIGMNRVFAALLAGQPPPPGRRGPCRRRPSRRLPRLRGRAAGRARRARSPRTHLPRDARDRQRRRATADPALRSPRPWLGPRAGHGAARRLPEDLAEQSLAFARTQLTGQARPGRFGPAQIVGEQASATERLVAFLGRPVNPGQ